ncbi:hypothetical protein [Cohnella sp. 56]|uniref:hypothetical protein n=1 Tax=Cohnella sp. 56 TaxID=3113722 RepID=UPI0030EAA770
MAIRCAGGEIEEALRRLAVLTAGCGAGWVVGGSAGLALRGARLPSAPRDLDIYADASAVGALHGRLADLATDGPAWDASGSYRSLLAHYRIGGVQIELVGDFEVRALASHYVTEVDRFLYAEADELRFEDGTSVRIVPLGHELIFNLLRERPDRTAAVGELIRAAREAHLPALERLLARQPLSEEVRRAALAVATGAESDSDGRGAGRDG